MKQEYDYTLIIIVDFILLRNVLNTLFNISENLRIEVEFLPKIKED